MNDFHWSGYTKFANNEGFNPNTGVYTLSGTGKSKRFYTYAGGGSTPSGNILYCHRSEDSGGSGTSYQDSYWTVREKKKLINQGTVTRTNGSVPDNDIASDGYWYVKTAVENVNGGWDAVTVTASLELEDFPGFDDPVWEDIPDDSWEDDSIYQVQPDSVISPAEVPEDGLQIESEASDILWYKKEE